MEAYIDSKNGGNGWYKIVDSPQQARAVINAGKLAVVLGIEVDHLFNCRTLRDCTEQDVRQELEKYYNKGVRHVFPIHFSDNGVGGHSHIHSPVKGCFDSGLRGRRLYLSAVWTLVVGGLQQPWPDEPRRVPRAGNDTQTYDS